MKRLPLSVFTGLLTLEQRGRIHLKMTLLLMGGATTQKRSSGIDLQQRRKMRTRNPIITTVKVLRSTICAIKTP
ncbi:hypothetical protein [Candidatus Nitrotoga arctica]|uniref:hypothetical protein n=1 Tax=Candidatus Nitrotoga arctica TaxID=453162 RepID=UPI001EFBD4D8|nr:hypothetical protein [Candidatus Nitrotoga arctica]